MNIKELEKKMQKQTIEQHIKLVSWLYKNHLKIWREYEDYLGLKVRLHILGDGK